MAGVPSPAVRRFPASASGLRRRAAPSSTGTADALPGGQKIALVEIDQPADVTADPSRWRHGQEHIVDPALAVQRVASTVRALRASGDISDAEVVAADRWYRDYVCGVEGARDPDRAGGNTAAREGYDTGVLSRVHAIGRCREVADTIGSGLTIWLHAMLIDELSFTAMAARFLKGAANGRKQMPERMASVLTALSQVYSAIDARRKGSLAAPAGSRRAGASASGNRTFCKTVRLK